MYRNRMLVAQEDLHLGTDYVTKGATFAATDTDADYLVGQKKAIDAELPNITVTIKGRQQPSAPAVEPEPTPESAPSERDDLLIQAEALGLKVDGRWSNHRLIDELAAFEPKA